MATNKTTTTNKQPKTVPLSIYIRDLALVSLVVGVTAFVGAHFMTVSTMGDLRSSVIEDLKSVSTTADATSKKQQ